MTNCLEIDRIFAEIPLSSGQLLAHSLLIPTTMLRLSKRDFFYQIALPCFVYVVLFFGASEIVEHYFFNRVSETIIHFLHFTRGLISAFFVAGLLLWILNRAERTFSVRMEAVCSLLNAANQGILALDSSGNVVSVNHRATDLLGSIHSGNFQDWCIRIRGLLQERTEIEILDPSGTSRLRVTSLQSQDSGSLLLLRDITQEKKMEEQWLIAEKLASVGRMAAGLAHEIGTPLNVISGRAELLQSMQLNECTKCESKRICPVEKHIKVIFQQIDRISGIIQQLLVQAREPNRQRSYFNPAASISAVIDLMKPCFEKKSIELIVHLDENLPAIYGFSDQLQQVLINLLTNSADAINQKEGVIEILAKSVEGEFQLSVMDSGSGITEENLTKIFDPFFTTKEFGKGTGLGLTVTANIIRSHGGQIEVSSESRKGTKFTIRLPAAPVPEAPAAVHETLSHDQDRFQR